MSKWGLLVFIIVLGAFILGACGAEDSNSPGGLNEVDGESEELQQVDIMLDWYPNAVHSYLFVAQEKGFFAEEGLDVTIRTPANPTDPINLAATGDVTLGITYQPDVIQARNQGVPVVSVAAIVRSPLNHIIFLDEADIQSPQDLVGKTVGYPGIPVNEPLLKTMVEADGGSYEDVNLVNVGFELGSSIISERADAVIGAYINHEVPTLINQGIDVRYFNPIDYGVPSFYELVIVTSEETLENDEEKIRAFWSGAMKGYAFMKDNPQDSLDILFNHENESSFPLNREVEEESLVILLDKMQSEGEAFGSQTTSSWEETIAWLLEQEFIDESPVVEDIFINIVD